MRHVLLFLFYRWQSWGTKMFLHSSARYRWPDNKSSPTNPWSSVLCSFLQTWFIGSKKKMCWWRLSQIFHSQACWPYVQCACPWSPQSQGQPTTPSLTSSVSPFPQLFPLNLTNMLKSPTTQSLSFFSPLPHSQVATVYSSGWARLCRSNNKILHVL